MVGKESNGDRDCDADRPSETFRPGEIAASETLGMFFSHAPNLVYRLAYNGDVVAFKMGRRQGARRAHILIDT